MLFKSEFRAALRKGAMEALKPVVAEARRRFYLRHRRRTGRVGRAMYRRVVKEKRMLIAEAGIPPGRHQAFYGYILVHGRRGYQVPRRRGKQLRVPISIPGRPAVPVFHQAGRNQLRRIEETIKRTVIPVVDRGLDFPPRRGT